MVKIGVYIQTGMKHFEWLLSKVQEITPIECCMWYRYYLSQIERNKLTMKNIHSIIIQ